MATCDGVSLTVPLRLIGPPLFAEATACVGDEFCQNLWGNVSLILLSTSL